MYHANYFQSEDGSWKIPCLPFALIGASLKDSMLPVMHNNLYRTMRLNWSYTAYECQDTNDAQYFIDCLRMGHYRGMNINFPFRRYAVEAADYATPDAQAAMSANVLVREETHISAYNTEGFGAMYALERLVGKCLSGSSVCIFGTGSTARAIAAAALELGVNDVVIFSNDLSQSQYVVKQIQLQYPYLKSKITSADYNMIRMLLPFYDVVISDENLDSCSINGLLLDGELFNSNQIVMDTDYRHGNNTPVLKSAASCGSKFFNGMEMFVEQAVLSVKIWARVLGLNLELDRDAMRVSFKE